MGKKKYIIHRIVGTEKFISCERKGDFITTPENIDPACVNRNNTIYMDAFMILHPQFLEHEFIPNNRAFKCEAIIETNE